VRNFKAIIQNKIDNSIFWEAWAETNEAAQTWIDQETLNVGKNIIPIWFAEADLSQEMIDNAIDERVLEGVKEFLIPAEAEANIYNLTEVRARENVKNLRKRKGFILRDLAQNILNIATGYFYDQNLTAQQVAGLKSTYPEVFTFLNENMPLTAKTYIDLMPIEGLITQELIDNINLEYDSYKELFPDIVIF